ncbi:hypothetical protein [Streptomyces sp. BPSDS2]|uniref:hypothetical protein n=1 Tax=Streptomyces sp. BPSDS2 TaxID=2571021 RepID=UPI0010C18E5E|nr:hypothetical protein [Streptomyces sp. BPSDS2]
MDNWREGKRTGHTHEPNDATIQLDGLGRQLAELPGEPTSPDGSDGPVFVDESGRRSKTFRRLGWVLAAVCAAYAVTLVFAVLGGNSSAPWLPLSEPKEETQAEQVEEVPAPGDAADDPSDDAPEPGPGASGSATPGASGAPDGATPSATSVLVPAGSANRPSASTSADPSRTTGGSGTGGATKPAPAASTAKPPVDPTQPPPETEPPAPTTPPAETPEPPVQEESAP